MSTETERFTSDFKGGWRIWDNQTGCYLPLEPMGHIRASKLEAELNSDPGALRRLLPDYPAETPPENGWPEETVEELAKQLHDRAWAPRRWDTASDRMRETFLHHARDDLDAISEYVVPASSLSRVERDHAQTGALMVAYKDRAKQVEAKLEEVRAALNDQIANAEMRREQTVGEPWKAIAIQRTAVLGEVIRLLDSNPPQPQQEDRTWSRDETLTGRELVEAAKEELAEQPQQEDCTCPAGAPPYDWAGCPVHGRSGPEQPQHQEPRCGGIEDRYVADYIAETGRAVANLLAACGNLLSVREHSPGGLDGEFEDFKAEVEAASAALYPTAAPEPQDGPLRSIELGEALPAWGAAKDQEGVLWLTCRGFAVLNLDAAFRRAAELPPHPSNSQEVTEEADDASSSTSPPK